MKNISIITISLVLLSSSVYGKLYRWVDDKGNVSYSDKIPQKAIKHGHIELTQRGLRKKKQLSFVQLKELEALKEEREKERKEQLKKEKLKEIKRKKNEQLLAIYSSREELMIVFENKITMSKMATKLLKERHKVLSRRLAKIEIKHEKMKNVIFKETISKKIDDMLDGLKVYQQAITENIIELAKLEARFKVDLRRYDRLTRDGRLVDDVDVSTVFNRLNRSTGKKGGAKNKRDALLVKNKNNMDTAKILRNLKQAVK
jgi:flagellar basal body rod protein FlgB